MNDGIIRPDQSDEGKANRKLAFWVGAIGLGGFGLCYILFFILMMVKPAALFGLIPTPSLTEEAISDGRQVYLLHQKIDFSTLDQDGEEPPEFKHYISPLTGGELGVAEEIPPYELAFGGNQRLLFLNEGSYRIYDRGRWSVEQADAIGAEPRGVLTPTGLYVLSSGEDGPQLHLIADGTTTPLPLPAEYLAWYEEDQCSCIRLALYQGRLALFWSGNETLSWALLDGEVWSPPATSPHDGGYDVIADADRLYLFQRTGEGAERTISYSVLADNAWTGPIPLAIEEEFDGWDVFLQQGKPKIFLHQLMGGTLYTIRDGALIEPLEMKVPYDPTKISGWLIAIAATLNGLALLAIFGASFGISRFKKRIWQTETAAYEFASLFQRFTAMMIDNLLLLIPPALLIAVALPPWDELPDDPFRLTLILFTGFGLYFGGGFLYHSLLEGLCGQTLGKRICGIKVLKDDFTPCGLFAGFLRNLLRIGDAFCYYLVAVVAVAATFKWQRVGDLTAETVVVKVRPPQP